MGEDVGVYLNMKSPRPFDVTFRARGFCVFPPPALYVSFPLMLHAGRESRTGVAVI